MNTRAAPWPAFTAWNRVPLLRSTVPHVLAGIFHRLLDGDRHFARLAITEADLAAAVADHRQRGEGELATALTVLLTRLTATSFRSCRHRPLHLAGTAIAAAGFALFCHFISR